jgi:hypothetical protein
MQIRYFIFLWGTSVLLPLLVFGIIKLGKRFLAEKLDKWIFSSEELLLLLFLPYLFYFVYLKLDILSSVADLFNFYFIGIIVAAYPPLTIAISRKIALPTLRRLTITVVYSFLAGLLSHPLLSLLYFFFFGKLNFQE